MQRKFLARLFILTTPSSVVEIAKDVKNTSVHNPVDVLYSVGRVPTKFAFFGGENGKHIRHLKRSLHHV